MYTVKEQYFHGKFNSDTYDYDYALLELEEPVEITKNVSIVKLVEPGVDLEVGTMLTVTGWGSTGVSIIFYHNLILF